MTLDILSAAKNAYDVWSKKACLLALGFAAPSLSQRQHSLTISGLSDTIKEFNTKYSGPPLKAIKLSSATLALFPLKDTTSISSFCGVRVEIDDSLPLGTFKEVYDMEP